MGIHPAYILDEMSIWEARELVKQAHLKNKENWEQTRLLVGIIANALSTKKVDIKEAMKFPWDEDYNDRRTAISNEEVERLKIKIENTKKLL